MCAKQLPPPLLHDTVISSPLKPCFGANPGFSVDISIDVLLQWFSIQLCVQQGQLDGKMLGGLLTGVNRAFPFLKGKSFIHSELTHQYKPSD